MHEMQREMQLTASAHSLSHEAEAACYASSVAKIKEELFTIKGKKTWVQVPASYAQRLRCQLGHKYEQAEDKFLDRTSSVGAFEPVAASDERCKGQRVWRVLWCYRAKQVEDDVECSARLVFDKSTYADGFEVEMTFAQVARPCAWRTLLHCGNRHVVIV